ncbi:MAG TPA: hypothetical protein VHL31_11540 [Geminicoccus sp.]|uniref:hypothetical protein n=1 Tax=Geminicoccus sp. TaxID=2024832 RepID=UPI002E3776F0|nr:hypothetical protein [Geminicoccus sp.]HEX2526912.1 hypothetical protein [Geminicoccus sp.]
MTQRAWSVNGLAAELGLDRRTVAKRLALATPHSVAPDGSPRWLLPEAVKALFAIQDDRRRIDFDEARQRKVAAEAQLAELELARQRGEVVAIEDVGVELEQRYAAVRARLMAMPPKLAPLLCPDEPATAQSMIEAAVVEALAELSERELDGLEH